MQVYGARGSDIRVQGTSDDQQLTEGPVGLLAHPPQVLVVQVHGAYGLDIRV